MTSNALKEREEMQSQFQTFFRALNITGVSDDWC